MCRILEERAEEEEEGEDFDAAEDHEEGAYDLCPYGQSGDRIQIRERGDAARRREAGDGQCDRLDGRESRECDEKAADRKDGGEEECKHENPSRRMQRDDSTALPYGKYHAWMQRTEQLCPCERDEYEHARDTKTTRRRTHAAANHGKQDE